MKKRIAVEVLVFLFILVFGCLAQTPKKQGVLPPETLRGQVVVSQGKVGLTPHSAVLTWTNPTLCVDGSACTTTGNQVYKLSAACPASGTAGFTLLYTSTTAIVTYTDTTITAPGTYCYYVTAVNSAGPSGPSPTAGGTLAPPPPPLINSPTNFTIVVN